MMFKALGGTHSKLILLTKNMSNTFEQMNSDALAIIGRYTAEKVTFSRLPLIFDQNETNEVGNWSWGEEFQGTLFPKDGIVTKCKSKQLTVLLRNDPPFVIVKSYPNGSKYAEGYLVDLWNCITERLDLSFEIKYYPTKEGDDFWNFTENGFMLEMERAKVDVALYANADFFDIYSYYTGVHTGVLLRLCMYEQKRRINYYQFIKTINPLCFQTLVFIGILSLFLMYIAGYNLADSTFYFLAISFNQGQGETLPTTYSIRIAIISFSISVLVFFYVSSASMTSLSVSDKDLGSTTLEEVVEHSYITKALIVEYTSAHVMMSYSDLMTTFEKLRRVKIRKLTSVTDALTATSEFKWFSFIERERVWPYLEEFKCCVLESNLQKVRPTLFLVRRNSSYIQAFRQESSRLMENGIISRLTKKWWPIIDTSRKEFISISLADVSIIFNLLIFGAMVSLLIFFIERHVGTAAR